MLTVLPTDMNEMASLEILQLNANRLSSLPLSVGQLQTLRVCLCSLFPRVIYCITVPLLLLLEPLVMLVIDRRASSEFEVRYNVLTSVPTLANAASLQLLVRSRPRFT